MRTLLFNLNRPGWAVNCVDFNEMSLDGIVQVDNDVGNSIHFDTDGIRIFLQDMNFCAYTGFLAPYIFDIRLGKIDTS